MRWGVLSGARVAAGVTAHEQAFFTGFALVVLLATSTLGMWVMPLWLQPADPTATHTFQAAVGGVASMLVVIWLNRSGQYRAAALLFVGAALLAPAWASLDRPVMLVFLFIAVQVATAILPMRAAVAASAFALLLHALVVLHPSTTWGDIVFPLSVNSIQIGLALVIRGAQRRLEQIRLADLARSERWFATTLTSIGDAVLTTDTLGCVSFMNPVAASLTGWSLAEARGLPVEQVFRAINEQDGAPREDPVRAVLREGRRVDFANHSALIAKSGVCRPIADSGAPILDDTGSMQGVVLVFRDMSQVRATEERLDRAERLESLGRLAGGVAHDFNNLLTVIGGGLELALSQTPQGSQLRADLEEVLQGTHRAVRLTGQLLAFSRRQIMQPRVVDINAAVTEATQLIRRMLKDNVDLATELGPRAGQVQVDPVQLEQVLINLSLNGGDAMPDGGRLILATDSVRVSSDELESLAEGEYVRLRVIDQGQGMERATLARAFEPFFTTKEPGRGTGLGLATVHGIVKQSGGSVLIDSVVGTGTTFTVLLPSSRSAQTVSATVEPRAPWSEAGAQQTLLVVEDDDAVRKLALRMLARLGYRVLGASSGEEALRLLGEHAGSIQLLITDIVMPGMTGPALVQALRARGQQLPVVFMSGYADEVVARHGVQAEGAGFLQKPFTPASLAAKVKDALKSA